jgi:hypothetical protein
MVARDIKLSEHPPYPPDLAPATSSKRELASLTITQDMLKKEWEWAVRSIAAADFAEAFQRWFQCHEKCVAISDGYVEKS